MISTIVITRNELTKTTGNDTCLKQQIESVYNVASLFEHRSSDK